MAENPIILDSGSLTALASGQKTLRSAARKAIADISVSALEIKVEKARRSEPFVVIDAY